MPHSQGLSNNPYLELNKRIPRIDTSFFMIHSTGNIVLHVHQGLHKGLFPIALHNKILEALLCSSILPI